MQQLFPILLISVVFNISTVNNHKDNINFINAENCDSLQTIAVNFYNAHQSIKAIEYFKLSADCFLKLKKYKEAGYCYLNISTSFDEKIMNLDSALFYSSKSLTINKDSFHQANVLKYHGLLLGKKLNYQAALEMLDSSRVIFQKLKADYGAAITDFDESQVHYYNNNYIQSQILFEKSLTYWQKKNASQRIFIMNVFGIKLAHKLKNSTLIKDYVEKNDSLLINAKIIQSNIDSFVYYKNKFYK